VNDTLRLGRILGFAVSVHWSVLVIVFLLAWGLAEDVLPVASPGHPAVTYWLAGITGAVLLIASLLAHELAHAVVARREGVQVEGLTLWLFGGVASLHGEATTPRADFRIAAVGPATSLALAAGFAVVWSVAEALSLEGIVVSLAAWLATINGVLAVFNLVPGAPLDGGRVLRAILWKLRGDRESAATSATVAGQVVGYCLVAIGLLAFLAGDSVGGLWTVLIGWFLLAAARAEQAATVTEHSLRGVTVGDVMSRDVVTSNGASSVEALIHLLVLGGRHSAYPVLDRHGVVEGLVTLKQLREVPSVARATTSVRDVALPLSAVATGTPEEPVSELLMRVTREAGGRALVFDEGRLAGIVTPADVTRALEVRGLAS
jgi:Zn-dependent protease/CBS domain-containing protein